MTISPDHQKLLDLAVQAFGAEDNRALWKKDIEEAVERHSAACDEVWQELRRQVLLYPRQQP